MTLTEKIVENFKKNAEAHNALQVVIADGDDARNRNIITDLLIEEVEIRLEKNADLFEKINALEPSAIAAMASSIKTAISKIVSTRTYVNTCIEVCAIAAARDVLHF